MDIVELGMDVDSRSLNKTNAEMDRFAKEGKRVDSAARGVEKSTGAMAAGMKRAAVAVAATVGAMASLGASVRILADFEKQMSTVGAVSRATAGEMQAMRDIAADLGSTTEFTAKQAGEGLEFLARAGFSAAESVKAIPAVLDLATAAAMDLGSAADISSNIMSAFSIEAGNAAAVADVLAAASSRANTDVGQLGDAMAYVGPVASSLDIAMSDAAAAIGVLSDAGIQGSSAGTGLRRVLSSLANPTTQAQAALSSLGLEMESLNPQTNDLTDIVDRLGASGLSAADALTIFGDRGGPAILALTSQTGRLEELTGALTDVEGESARMANTMRDNLGGDIDSLGSSIQGLVIALGDAGLTAVIRTVIQAVTGLVRGITAVVGAFESASSAVAGFARDLLGVRTAEEIRESAIDNVTIALGDQMRASEQLRLSMESGLSTNLSVIEAKLEEARARRAVIQEIVAERQELELQAMGYSDLVAQIATARDALRSMAASGEQVPRDMQEQFEAAQAALVDMLQRQQEMLESVREGNFLREEEEAHLQTIQDNIDALRRQQAGLTDDTAENVELTDRLGYLASSINFDNATASAGLLARQLGLGMEAALGMNAALNRSAGIQVNDNAAIGLSFPGGTPDGSGPGSFTGAGGRLIFGDLSNAPDPADFKSFVDEIKRGGRVAGGTAKQADDLSKKIKQLEFDADPVSRYNAEVEALNDLMATGELSSGAYEAELQKLNDGLADQLPLVNDVASAWGEFVADGFRDFKGFADSVLDSFKSLVAEMISTAARNQIILRIAAIGGGSVAGTAASAAGALGGGGGGGLLGLGNLLGGGGGIIGGILGTGGGGLAGLAGSGGILGGIGSVASGVSGILSGGGLGASFANLGGLLSGSVGGLGAVGAALPALGIVGAGVGLIVSAFKKKVKELDNGLQISLNEAETAVNSFQLLKESRFFGLSTSRKTKIRGVPEETAAPIREAIAGIRNATVEAAGALGIAEDAFDGFSTTIRVSLKGLSQSQQEQAVADGFSRIRDSMAGVIPGLNQYVQSNETLGETLQRLSSSLVMVNQTFGVMDYQMFSVSLAGADMASSLVNLLGGLQGFSDATSFFVANFFTDAEQLQVSANALHQEFQRLNITTPKNALAFRRLVEAQDLTTQSGRETYAALLQIAPAFANVAQAAAQAANTANAAAAQAQSAAGGAAAAQAQAVSALEVAIPQQQSIADAQAAAEARQREIQQMRREAEKARAEAERQARRQRAQAEAQRRAQQRQAEAQREANEAAREAQRIADERSRLETRYFKALGDEVTLREREIAALDPANRAFGRMVIMLEEAKKAADALSESDFATQVAFNLARARALNFVGVDNVSVPSAANVPDAPQVANIPPPSTTPASTSGAGSQVATNGYLAEIAKKVGKLERNVAEILVLKEDAG